MKTFKWQLPPCISIDKWSPEYHVVCVRKWRSDNLLAEVIEWLEGNTIEYTGIDLLTATPSDIWETKDKATFLIEDKFSTLFKMRWIDE